MGARILKQPNGLYTRWSYITDCPTHYNMTAEEYRNYRLEKAKKEIEQEIQDAEDFDTYMKESEHFVYNMSKEEFAKFLNDIDSTLTLTNFYFLPGEEENDR